MVNPDFAAPPEEEVDPSLSHAHNELASAELNSHVHSRADSGVGYARQAPDVHMTEEAMIPQPTPAPLPRAEQLLQVSEPKLVQARAWAARGPGAQMPSFIAALSFDDMNLVARHLKGAPSPAPTSQVQKHNLPKLLFFIGKNVTPRHVRGWLSSVKLQWAQLRPDDKTLFALSYLSEDAAIWRDVYIIPRFGGVVDIPPQEFEDMLLKKYIPMGVALKAEQDFACIRQRGSVEKYNADFELARDELCMMPHVTQPDASTQTKISVSGLKPAVEAALHSRVTQADLSDLGPFTVQQVINDVAYMLELPKTWRAHEVFHVSLQKPFIDNGEPVAPMPFNLIGGSDNQFEVKRIVDLRPKTPKQSGAQRRVKELSSCVEWLGLPMGTDAWQPWSTLKGTCDAALTDLAQKWKLPAEIFQKGMNRLPYDVREPASDLPPPPAVHSMA